MTITTPQLTVDPGLAGVVVADTEVGAVHGAQGWFHYRGHDATTLAADGPFERVWHLVHHGHLPSPAELDAHRRTVGAARVVPIDQLDQLARLLVAASADPASPTSKHRRAWIYLRFGA